MNREESLPRSNLGKLKRRTTACAPPRWVPFSVSALKLDFHMYAHAQCSVVKKRLFGFVLGHCKYMKGALFILEECCVTSGRESQQQMKLYQMTYFPCQDNLTSISTVEKTLPPCPCCFLIKNKIHVLFVIL